MKSRFFKLFACVGSIAVLCMQSSPAEAIFASVKATGMAATCIAYPQDSLVAAYNPAGMAFIGNRLDIEGAWIHDTGRGRISGNDSALAPLVNHSFKGMKTKDVYPVGFGYNRSYCLCGFDVSLGFVLYNRNFQKTTYTKPLVLLGTSKPGLEYINQTFAPVISVKFCENHSFGIAINRQIQRFKVKGIEKFDNLIGSIKPGHVTNREYSYSFGWMPTFGYYGQWTDCLSVGVTYQPETPMKRFHKYSGFLAHRGRLNIPRKIGAGIAYRITPCITVAFDVEQIHWAPIHSLRNKLLHNGNIEQLGSKHGPGFGFRDQMYYRVGIDWQIDPCWCVRMGFRHARAPFKRSQTTVNLLLLDCVEDFLTFGATWSPACNHEISALFAWGFHKKIHGKGQTIPDTPTLGGGKVNVSEQKYALGLAWGYCY